MTTATDMLAQYLAAEAAVLSGQSVHLGGKSLSLPDLPAIRKGRQEWEARVSAEAAARQGGSTLRFSVARLP